MGLNPLEVSLNLKPGFVPKTITCFLKEVSMIGDVSERQTKLDEYVKRLEEEMRKIDAFKRELPHCMILLSDAIEALKNESIHCAPSLQPVLEEFIPLKKDCEDEHTEEVNMDNDFREKKSWMSSLQLWNTADHPTKTLISNQIYQRAEGKDDTATDDRSRSCKSQSEGTALMPFKEYSDIPVRKQDKELFPVHGLTLLTPREETGCSGSSLKAGSKRAVSSSTHVVQSNFRSTPQQQQNNRKQRRCWSPELHRRFVNALQQLGGSHVATPKQIRELMQVDGLTNDEVKSHLQKYRLHTRRIPSSANQSSVGLGGVWVSQDQYEGNDSSKQSNSQSGSPQGPLQLGGTAITGGDSMEDEDDDRSESSSWKGHIHKVKKHDV